MAAESDYGLVMQLEPVTSSRDHAAPAVSSESTTSTSGTNWESYGVSRRGLSENDFMKRQRYLENSCHCNTISHAVSMASEPPAPKCSSSFEVHHFIQQQRKIISKFRSQPWPMQMKLAAVKSYRSNVSKYIPHLSALDTVMDTSGQVYRGFRHKFETLVRLLTIWGTIIKKIEGNFGTSVASYFIFLRWLGALNFTLMILITGFVLVPQLVSGKGLEIPAYIRGNHSALSLIVDGKGYMFEYSVLFYGYYDSGQNEQYTPPPANPNPYIGYHYKLPLAYLLVIATMFCFCAVAILFSMAEKYKLFQRATVSEQYPFSWKVFASWDYAITDTSTASCKVKQLIVLLKETIVEAKKKEDTERRIVFWIIRILTNSIVMIFVLGSGYGIFLSVETAERYSEESDKDFHGALVRGWHGIWTLILSFLVQIVIVARNFLLPFLFNIAQYAERFHPRTALKVKLFRMFLLYFSSLYVLMIALFIITKKCSNSSEASENCVCWETTIGQELYKLTLTHLLADICSIGLIEGSRWVLSKMSCRGFKKINRVFNKWIGRAQFDVAENVLKLVYGQALILFGVLFCPILPGIGFCKNILIFYCRAFSVYIFNRPPKTLFRVASTRNFYMAILLVTVFMCSLPVGYAVVEMTPSLKCGPFRGLPSMLQVIYNEIETWPNIIQKAFLYAQTATVVVPVLFLLGIIIYYYAALSHALKEVNKDLRLQLRVEQNETRQRIAKEVEAVEDEHQTSASSQNHRQMNRHQELKKAIEEQLKQQLENSFNKVNVPSPSRRATISNVGDRLNTRLDPNNQRSYLDPHMPQISIDTVPWDTGNTSGSGLTSSNLRPEGYGVQQYNRARRCSIRYNPALAFREKQASDNTNNTASGLTHSTAQQTHTHF